MRNRYWSQLGFSFAGENSRIWSNKLFGEQGCAWWTCQAGWLAFVRIVTQVGADLHTESARIHANHWIHLHTQKHLKELEALTKKAGTDIAPTFGLDACWPGCMWQSRPRCRQCTGASFAQDMRFLNVFVGTCFEFFAKIQVFRSIISAYSNKADLPANWPSRRKDLKYLSTIFNCLSTLVVVSFFASPYWRDFCLAKLCPRSQDLEVLFCCQLWCLTTWWLVHS